LIIRKPESYRGAQSVLIYEFTFVKIARSIAIGLWKIAEFKKIMANSTEHDNSIGSIFKKASSIEFGLYLVVFAGIVLVIIPLAPVDTKTVKRNDYYN
jgi:hypothetical protein